MSIIVVSWNSRDYVLACLASVFAQTRGITYEVFLVDNASADGVVDDVRQTFPDVHVIANRENRGFGAANNQAIRLARGRYILCLNPDTVILDGAIQKTVSVADAAPDLAVLGCRVYADASHLMPTCFAFPTPLRLITLQAGLEKLFPNSRLFGGNRMAWWGRDTPRDVDVVEGMYMLVRRTAIDEVGLFDEDFFIYAEETDWCYRFWKAGWRCAFTPDAAIIHVDGGEKSTGQVATRMFVQKQKSLLLFSKKHYGWIAYLTCRAAFFLGMAVRGISWAIAARLRGSPALRKRAKMAIAAARFHLLALEPAHDSGPDDPPVGDHRGAAQSSNRTETES